MPDIVRLANFVHVHSYLAGRYPGRLKILSQTGQENDPDSGELRGGLLSSHRCVKKRQVSPSMRQ